MPTVTTTCTATLEARSSPQRAQNTKNEFSFVITISARQAACAASHAALRGLRRHSHVVHRHIIAQNVKTWIDLLVIDKDLAFGSRPLAGRPAIFAIARGGGYGPGSPKHGWDHATPYLERIFGDVFGMNLRTAAAELTLAPVTPGMEELIDASKVSESEAHVEAGTHGSVVARELIGKAA